MRIKYQELSVRNNLTINGFKIRKVVDNLDIISVNIFDGERKKKKIAKNYNNELQTI